MGMREDVVIELNVEWLYGAWEIGDKVVVGVGQRRVVMDSSWRSWGRESQGRTRWRVWSRNGEGRGD